MTDVSSEIGEMLDTFEGKVTEPVEEKEEVKEEIKEEEVKEEEVKEEEEEIKEGVKEEPILDEKDQIIADLRKQLEEQSSKKKEEPIKEEIKEEPFKIEEHDFLGDLDLDDLTRDKTSFNKLLNNVYSKGVLDSKSVIGESVLRAIPDIVKTNMTIMTSLKEASDNFYKENKDLAPFKKVVAMVFEEVAAKNPDKKYNEILEDVGNEARKRLNLQKEALKKKEDPPPKLPSKGNGGRGDPKKPDLSKIESELAAMNETLTRR